MVLEQHQRELVARPPSDSHFWQLCPGVQNVHLWLNVPEVTDRHQASSHTCALTKGLRPSSLQDFLEDHGNKFHKRERLSTMM